MQTQTKENFFSARIREFAEINRELAVFMNKIHGTAHSERYWRILLYPYITSVLGAKEALSKKLIETPPSFEPGNTALLPSFKQKVTAQIKYILSFISTLGNLARIRKILKNNNSVVSGFHHHEVICKEAGPMLPTYFPALVKRGNMGKRKLVDYHAGKYDNIYYRNVMSRIPKLYIEYYDDLCRMIPINRPEAKTFHVSVINSFFDRALIAEYVERGARLHYYQHGGYYGEEEWHFSHWIESSFADKFITWGWKINEKDEPGKAYRLNGFRDLYFSAGKKKKYDCVLCYPLLSSANEEEYSGYTKEFISTLDTGKYPRIIARPRTAGKWKDMSHTLDFIQSDKIIIDTGKINIAKLIRSTDVVVHFMHPSTTFLECLYVDHPIVSVLINEYPTDIVKPYYDFFLEHKVFHLKAEDMAHHLNTVDIKEWWKSIVAHPTYQAYKNEFLREA